MRFDGKIKTWDDERGFGFIEPAVGGEDIFVHIKAISRLRGRPQAAQLVTFEVELGPRGKKRAMNVEPIREAVRGRGNRQASANKFGTATLFVILLFLIIYLSVAVLWHPSRLVALIYLCASAITFWMYAADKAAAKAGTRRTPEVRLHVAALAGGWPGALIAHQLLRHKSSKTDFRRIFWVTVVLNIAAFVALCSPFAQRMYRGLLPYASIGI